MMRSTTAAFVAACLSVAVFSAQQPPAAGQQPPVTFKVEIDYVEVDAVVTDEQDTFVRDLKQSDFQVFEDGKPQQVTVFSLVDIPIERGERPLFAEQPVEPDVRSNREPFEGRLYVIVLDDLHTDVLRSQLVRTAARRFIDRYVGANDLAAVLHTSGRTDRSQGLTSSYRLLAASVDKFMGDKLRSATLERIDAYNRLAMGGSAPGRVDDPIELERGYKARSALRTLKAVAEWLNGIHGRRKAIVYISEGIDYDIYDVFNKRDATSLIYEARDTITAATRSNVNIYAIDPRGLTQLGDDAITVESFPDNQSQSSSGSGDDGQASGTTRPGIGYRSMQDELRLAQDSLRSLAEQTGGFAAVNSNDFARAFDRIVRENSSYYVLGYYPTNTRRDGRLRKIDVRVSRPGLRVSARKGYVAPSGRPPQPAPPAPEGSLPVALRAAIENPLPVSGLTVTTAAAAFKGVAPNASVAVIIQLDPSALKFTERDETYNNRLDMSVMALDREGKVVKAERMNANLALKPQTYEAVSRGGIRLTARLELPPGQYQLRVGGLERGNGATGSVHYDLEVPDFSKAPLGMSGLVIGSASAARIPTARPDSELQQVLPAPPTTERAFAAEDTLVLFAEVYDNQASTPHTVDISTTVHTNEGEVVFKDAQERSTKEIMAARGGFGHMAEIPLQDLKPGLYLLRVEARSRLGDNPMVSREVLFRVR